MCVCVCVIESVGSGECDNAQMHVVNEPQPRKQRSPRREVHNHFELVNAPIANLDNSKKEEKQA